MKKDFWDRNAKRYDRFMKKDAAAYRKMYGLIRPVVKSRTTLELATGTGLIAWNIAGETHTMEATDASPDMIAQAKRESRFPSAKLHFSVHAPFPAYVAGKPESLDYMIEVYKKCILFCDRVGCKNLVIHGITLTRKDRGNTPATIKALNDRLYTSLIPVLVNTNVTVCMENLFSGAGGIISGVCSDPYEAVDMIDRYNAIAGKECFGLCLDTGHLNLLKLDVRWYIPILGKRIKALHIHDNDGVTDQYKAPYTGTIVWKDFYNGLREIGFDGDLSFETFHQTSIGEMDEELVAPWLSLIFRIGEHFRNKIQEN